MIQQDKDRLTVLEYLYKNKHGYINELDKLIQPNIISELLAIGFLKTGWTKDAETWAITPFGKQYYNVVKPHTSLFAKIFQRKR